MRVNDIEVWYGLVPAIHVVSLNVPHGGIVAILGPNGSGKTTLLNSISGIVPTLKGTITFEGREIQNQQPDKIVRCGISHVPEGRQVFPHLLVIQNLMAGAYSRSDSAAVHETLDMIFDCFPLLKNRSKALAGQLSGGEQQLLMVAQALMARPKLLMLDEPSVGLSPAHMKELFDVLKLVNKDQGTALLLVEQNAPAALSVADYGYVMEVGRVVAQGSAQKLIETDGIRETYLGI